MKTTKNADRTRRKAQASTGAQDCRDRDVPWAVGRRVLVVEDDYMLALTLCERLERDGAVVIGPAGSVAEALALLDAEAAPDSAILDTHLEDEESYPLADVLLSRRIPFVLATNSEAWMIPSAYLSHPRTEKPVDLRRVAHALDPRGLAAP